MSPHHFHLRNEAATAAFGAALSRVLMPGLAVYLQGELGVGKTATTRALLHALGYQGRVKSPTYTLVEPYPVKLTECTATGAVTRLVTRLVTINHFDLYRLSSPEEFLEAGFREYFNADSICIIEWPEKGQPVLPAADIHLWLRLAGSGRDVELRALSDKGHQCLARLKFAPNL